MSQMHLLLPRPMRPVTYSDLNRVPSFEAAIRLVMESSGLQDKSIAIESEIDAAQLSKIASGQAGILPSKLSRLQKACGSYLPLFYLCWAEGFDPLTMRQKEVELERKLRLAEERNQALEARLQHITEFVKEVKAA
jgi:hypothetical protein